MIIRKTKIADMAACEEIYASAREYMRSSGNPDQWKNSYPGTVEILSDIASGCGYVVEDKGEVIYDGEWKSDAPYGVIHRVAVKHHGMGIIDFIFSECFNAAGHLRIDTHKDNIPMQKVLRRCGFEYCGIIHLASGDERLAYEK